MAEQTVSTRRQRRWSDNDRHFGPFTFAFEKYRQFAVVLCSGSEAREDPGCCIRFHAFGLTAICELPQIIKPWRTWVDLRGKKWAHGDGYWDEHPREYGFRLSDGYLHVKLGAQTMDSSTDQDWGWFLPWKQWRQVAHRLYDADGFMVGDVAFAPWDSRHELTESLSKTHFAITDYDGERIEAETYVEEREWRLGTGRFRWLGYIAPKKRSRSLEITFQSEVGREKGSWKGGLIGTGIEMSPGETEEQAFRRYCDQDHRSKSGKYRVTFAGTLS